mgnify:CR=1 FL=1
MPSDRTNRLAMLLVVFCCLGTTAMAVPSSTQTVLSVVVACTSMHIAYELKPVDFQCGNNNANVFFTSQLTTFFLGVNLELQNLPPPLIR